MIEGVGEQSELVIYQNRLLIRNGLTNNLLQTRHSYKNSRRAKVLSYLRKERKVKTNSVFLVKECYCYH